MTCREFVDFVGDYILGTLPAGQRQAFMQHLADCRDCRNYLASYKQSILLGKAAMKRIEETVPAEVPQELVRAILSARSAK